MKYQPEAAYSKARNQDVPIFFLSRKIKAHVITDKKTAYRQQDAANDGIYKRMGCINIDSFKKNKLDNDANEPPGCKENA